MQHFDGRGLEAEHGPDAPLDGPVMSASTTRLTQRRGSIRADTARAWRAHALIAKRAIDLQEERLMLSVAGIEPLRNFLLDLLAGR
jgi:hypothetical protein